MTNVVPWIPGEVLSAVREVVRPRATRLEIRLGLSVVLATLDRTPAAPWGRAVALRLARKAHMLTPHLLDAAASRTTSDAVVALIAEICAAAPALVPLVVVAALAERVPAVAPRIITSLLDAKEAASPPRDALHDLIRAHVSLQTADPCGSLPR